jgi:hypothetical protein
MTELEKLLTEQLSKLSAAHELQFKQLSDVQQQQAKLIAALSQRVEKLTQLLQS